MVVMKVDLDDFRFRDISSGDAPLPEGTVKHLYEAGYLEQPRPVPSVVSLTQVAPGERSRSPL